MRASLCPSEGFSGFCEFTPVQYCYCSKKVNSFFLSLPSLNRLATPKLTNDPQHFRSLSAGCAGPTTFWGLYFFRRCSRPRRTHLGMCARKIVSSQQCGSYDRVSRFLYARRPAVVTCHLESPHRLNYQGLIGYHSVFPTSLSHCGFLTYRRTTYRPFYADPDPSMYHKIQNCR